MNPASAVNRYTGDQYIGIHEDWHLSDAEEKARDLLPAFRAMPGPLSRLTVADVGTGAGGVPVALGKALGTNAPKFVGFEIAGPAVRLCLERFPGFDIRQKALDPSDGPFDAVMFVDVLEHLENPWEMLRVARKTASHLIVRQPLLDNFGLFRHNKYTSQRDTLGHIAFFNYHSFVDMAAATGWRPLHIDLVSPWSRGIKGGPLLPVKKLLGRIAPVTASFALEGFYLNGVFSAG